MLNERKPPAMISSSAPPAFSADQASLFREVIELLEREDVPFAVSGAFALHEYTGIWRDTKDLDLFMPAVEVGHALTLLERDGFQTEVVDSVWLAKAWRGDYYVDLITGMSNAAIRVDDFWIQRARRSEVLGVPSRILQPEELIASKVFVTRRERFDGADICHVIYGTQGKLDWNHLLNLLGENWQILFWHLVLYQFTYPAHTDYVPVKVWQELLQRFAIELACPNSDLGFRGSLIDENMFAIDTQEWGKRNVLGELRRRAELIRAAS